MIRIASARDSSQETGVYIDFCRERLSEGIGGKARKFASEDLERRIDGKSCELPEEGFYRKDKRT